MRFLPQHSCARTPAPTHDTVQYDLRKDGAAMFERIRRRVPASTWADILKVLYIYSEGILTDRDVTDLLSAAVASPSNDLATLFDDFMARCAVQPHCDAQHTCTHCFRLFLQYGWDRRGET